MESRFFDLVGALGAIVALLAVGASFGIVARIWKDHSFRTRSHIVLLASSWCLLAATHVFKFWMGDYSPAVGDDRIVLWSVFLAFTCGGAGLWLLWNRPQIQKKSEKKNNGT